MPRTYGTTNAAPYAVAPAVGAAGDTYYNTASKTLYLSDGTSWNVVSGGGGATSAYWVSRLVPNSVISNTIEGTLPISAPTMASGFTLGVGGANVVCQVAGKYAATLVLMTGTSTASASPFWVGIQQFRGATNIVNWDNIGLAAVNGYPYNQVIAGGEFDMQVGDTLGCVAQAPVTSYTVGAQSTLFIWPIGGPKGDPGIPGNLASANWWWSSITGPATVAPGGVTLTLGTPFSAQGFHRAGDGLSAVCDVAGWYRVGFHLSQSPGGVTAYSDVHIELRRSGSVLAYTSAVGDGQSTTTAWNAADGEAIMNLAVGDGVSITLLVDATHNIDSRSYMSIIPVGGAKGDPGPPGIPGNLASANFYHGYASSLALTANTPTPITWNTQGTISGFTPASGAGALLAPSMAGRYKVDAQITVQNGGSASLWTMGIIEHYNASGVLQSNRQVVGAGAAPSAFSEPAVSGVFDMVVGDYVRVLVSHDTAGSALDARSWVEITPVGGAKGDQGIQGTPGVAVGTTAWVAVPFSAGWSSTAGYAPCMYRLEGDRVWLRGGCTRSPTAFTAGGSSIATFPVGFRPPVGALSFILQVYGGGVRTDLGADGSFVMQQDYKIGTPQSLAYVNLDGVSWSITA